MTNTLKIYLDNLIKDQVIPSYQAMGFNMKRSIQSGVKDINSLKPVDENTLYDIASLTKVVSTVTCILCLMEEGKLSLSTRVQEILDQYPSKTRIRDLLTHTSGLEADIDWKIYDTKEKILDYIYSINLKDQKHKLLYSDLGYIILGQIIEVLTGSLEVYFKEKISQPLEMNNTCFNPLDKAYENIAATEVSSYRKTLIQGQVHDEKAYILGGIAGHAGLFSTASDLKNFVTMILGKGMFKDQKILSHHSIDLLKRTFAKDLDEERSLGWIRRMNYHGIGDYCHNAIFHSGFTGTSILIDFDLNFAFILLTNRVHPSRDAVDFITHRSKIHNLAVLSD